MASPTVAAKTVVIATDDAFVCSQFRRALEHAGHHAIVMGSGSALLKRLTADPTAIDLVLLDFRLPPMPGMDLIRAIRALDSGRTPILVFSGTIDAAGDVRTLAALGVGGYMNEHSAAAHIAPALAPHLFPDNFNRRSGPRVALSIPVHYVIGGTTVSASMMNLGHGGVAIRTTAPAAAGGRIDVRFEIPGTRHEALGEGQVMWADRRVGMGIQFGRVASATQLLVDGFVDGHDRLGRRMPRDL